MLATLFFGTFSVLVGFATTFSPVLVVINENPVSVLNISHGTPLTIWLPCWFPKAIASKPRMWR